MEIGERIVGLIWAEPKGQIHVISISRLMEALTGAPKLGPVMDPTRRKADILWQAWEMAAPSDGDSF